MAFGLPLLGLIGSLFSGLGGGMASKNAGGSFFGGSKGNFQQVGRFTPQQQQLLNSILPMLQQSQGQGFDYLNSILGNDPQSFSQFEAPAMRQYQQEILPQIAERFAGLGSHGSQNSSAFQQTLGQSGRELSQNLASMRQNLKGNALNQLTGLLGVGFQPSFESVYRQPTTGFAGGLASGLGQGASSLLGYSALSNLGVS